MHPTITIKDDPPACLPLRRAPFFVNSHQRTRVKQVCRAALLVIAFSFFTTSLPAQDLPESEYFTYKVLPGETFSSIAALYNLAPDQLAEYNNLDYYEGSIRSKTLRIPLKPVSIEVKKNPELTKEVEEKKISRKKEARIASLPTPKETDPVQAIKVDEEPIESLEPEPPLAAPDTIKSVVNPPPAKDTFKKVAPVNYAYENQKVLVKENSSFPPLREIMPLLIFLLASIILLIAGIYFYRAVKK